MPTSTLPNMCRIITQCPVLEGKHASGFLLPKKTFEWLFRVSSALGRMESFPGGPRSGGAVCLDMGFGRLDS